MIPAALIGHTGFVGGNLARQTRFDATYNSSNIAEIRGRGFVRLVCAGVGAVKWWANQNPEEDLRRINLLLGHLAEVEADQMTLISTTDVFADPVGVSEADQPTHEGLHPYGRHRLMLEEAIAAQFPTHSIIRLPALFGPGLKKNALYDLMHDHMTAQINPLSRFQWYPLARLAADLALAETDHLRLSHFAVEPVSMAEIHDRFFPDRRIGTASGAPANYDIRTAHAGIFGGADGYLLDRAQVMAALAAFLAVPAPVA